MTRLGWSILAIILVVVIAFGSMLSFGPGRMPPGAAPRIATPVEPATAGTLTVPVAGITRSALHDSWGDARGGGTRRHQALDIMAPGGTPVVAAADGVVEKLHRSAQGGTTLYLRTARGGWMHYYAHLSAYAAGMREGLRVRAGEVIGFVGDTGNAGRGNTHLHFGVSRMRRGERWWQGEPVNPYPLLARAGTPR